MSIKIIKVRRKKTGEILKAYVNSDDEKILIVHDGKRYIRPKTALGDWLIPVENTEKRIVLKPTPAKSTKYVRSRATPKRNNVNIPIQKPMISPVVTPQQNKKLRCSDCMEYTSGYCQGEKKLCSDFKPIAQPKEYWPKVMRYNYKKNIK